MKLLSDLSFFPLDNDTIVFSEQAQGLLSLNPLATDLVHALQEGHTPQDLIGDLTETNVATAEATASWVASTVDALAAHGFIEDAPGQAPAEPDAGEEEPPPALTFPAGAQPFAPIQTRCYRLLNTNVAFHYTYNAQATIADTVIGHLAAPAGAEPDFVIDVLGARYDEDQIRSDVVCDGVRLGHAQRLSFLGPIVKAALWERAVNAFDFLFFLHAGVVVAGDRCVLLPAASGSGKSSLTAALTHAGFRYYSDEVALLERGTFLVPPVPLSICVKDTGWDLMARYYPELLGLVTHRRQDRKIVRYIPPPASAANSAPMPVSHIIFPRYEAGATTQINPLPRAAALGQLMDECLALRQRMSRESVSTLVEWIRGIECYRLTFSSLDEAVALVRQVVGVHPQPP